MRLLFFFIFGGLLLELTGAGRLQAQGQIYYNGSLQFATGSYFFTETTESFYLTNGLGINHPRYNLTLNLPFVVQSSPWISYGGTGALPTGGPQHGSVGDYSGHGPGGGMGGGGGGRHRIVLPDTSVSYTSSGFSDPTVSAGYRLFGSGSSTTVLDLTASVKFPFADPTRGFGTGAWDLSAGGSFSQRLGRWFVMANLSYWYFGDMSDLELKDAWNYGAGLGKSFSGGKWMALGTFSGLTEIIEDTDPPMSAGLGISRLLGSRTTLSANLFFGLSESTSDVAFGAGWQIRLN